MVVFDDGSDTETLQANAWLKNDTEVRYRKMPENIGRSAIRNRLASLAQASYLLFLDDDSKVYRPDFLSRYLACREPSTVVCGGREYSKELPGEAFSLHWQYGHKKESRPARQKASHPYRAFHSNNFMIPRRVWQKLPFDESLQQYGHEDTLLGYGLQKAGFPVQHIDNPIIHAQLETNAQFLAKTRLAVQNLKLLYDRGEQGFNASVNLLRVYQRAKTLGLAIALAGLFKTQEETWEKNLSEGHSPSLRTFNLYKLGYLCSL
ncbi:MAG: glycosyltransferase [Owenweeksia sp.]|nr:glycosyltransferase [Owenweeksia sp.]